MDSGLRSEEGGGREMWVASALSLSFSHPPYSTSAAISSSEPSFFLSCGYDRSSRCLSPHCVSSFSQRRKWRNIRCCLPQSSKENNSSFCIIEGPGTVQDFARMEHQEIQDNIRSRRNKIFLLMEEVRRLRVQQRIKDKEFIDESNVENEMLDMPSTIPFLSRTTEKSLKKLYLTSFSFISGIIIFGGLLAPSLELKLGIGGTSYEDFIRNVHLPLQLSQVDPIVASFSGGAVGVISALMLVEVNNVEQQTNKRCRYCHGTGYLACATCSASGLCISIEPVSIAGDSSVPLQPPKTQRCINCSGAGKVMCPTCLCTGMVMASEHDPRIDPFDLK